MSDQLRLLCYNAYLAPTFHIHTTHWGILTQSRRSESGQLQFMVEEVQSEAAEEALENANILLLQALETLHDFFELGQRDKVLRLAEEWEESWDIIWRSSEIQPEPPPVTS